MAAQALAPQYASRHALISTYATARAPLFRRTLGWFIDTMTVMVPAGVLVGLAVVTVAPGLPAYLGAVAGEVGRSSPLGLFTHRGQGAAGVGDLAADEWGIVAMPLIGALLLVPMIQFLYLSVLLGWRGRTLGQMLVDLRIGRMGMDFPRPRRARTLRWAFGTTVVESGLTAVALVALLVGEFRIAALLVAVAVAAFWINACVVVGPRRRTIVDRLCGTVLVRRPADAPEPAGKPAWPPAWPPVDAPAWPPVDAPAWPPVDAPVEAPVVAPVAAAGPTPALTSSTGVYQTYQPREPTYPLRVRRSSSIGR